MRKIFLKYNWATTVFLLMSFVLTSCLKDKGVDDGEYQLVTGNNANEGAEYVSIPMAAKKPNTLGLESKDEIQTVDLFKASYDFVNAASSDITVTMERNDALVTAYDPTIELIPSASVQVPSLDLVIGAGKRISDNAMQIKINTGHLNALKKYGIGFTLKSVSKSGVSIPDNLKNVIFVFPIKNKYDGQYKLTQTTSGWAAYGISDNQEGTFAANIGLVTSDVNKVTIYNYGRGGDALVPAFTTGNASATAFGAATPEYVFDPATNALTNVVNTTPDDGRGRAFKLNTAAGVKNYYDPATKTIYADYFLMQTGRPDMRIVAKFVFDKAR